jgi:esterase
VSPSAIRAGAPEAVIVGHGAAQVIVSHGWIADCSLFDAVMEEIETDRFTFAFLDHRGYGRRATQEGPRTIEASAEDALALAASLGWETFSVVGHSMGGMVAQMLSARSPRRMEAMVLVASVPACGAKLDAATRAQRLAAVAEPDRRRQLLDANTSRKYDRAWLDALLELSLSTTSAEPMRDYLDSWSETDFADAVAGCDVPTLVLVGALDTAVSVDLMRRTVLAWYPNAVLDVMLEVGHYPMVESPGELYCSIARFLEQQGLASAG